MTPQSAPAHLLFFPVDCLHAFSDVFMLLFKGTPSHPKGLSFIGSLSISRGERRFFMNSPVYEKQTWPVTNVLPVRGRIAISGERCCRMYEGQRVQRGVTSKFRCDISGPTAFRRYLPCPTWSGRCKSPDILNDQMVHLQALQLVHIGV